MSSSSSGTVVGGSEKSWSSSFIASSIWPDMKSGQSAIVEEAASLQNAGSDPMVASEETRNAWRMVGVSNLWSYR